VKNQKLTKRSCLIVDDNDPLRQTVRDILLNADWQVEEAANGTEALRKISQARFGVVLLDILMPEKDWLEVLLELEKTPTPDRPCVVAMSGGGRDVTGSLALQLAEGLGAGAILHKPFSLDELQKAMG